jgi:energy-coupling factor transporter ATP-binding protein EcfA2
MLISFTVENYRSFADEQTLSLEAVKDDTHPDHVVNRGKFSLLKSIAIYGSNASGKSNLLKAFDFMARFVRTSATKMNLGDPIRRADCFRLDKARAGMPCSFDIRLLLGGTEYQYGFSATRERVHDEWLYVKREGTKSSNPLSRQFDPATEQTDWKLRGELKGAHDLIEKTRNNGLFLSRAAEMNVDFIKDLFSWFAKRVRYLNLPEVPRWLTRQTIRRIEKDNVFRNRVERSVHDADFGIDGLTVIQSEGFYVVDGDPIPKGRDMFVTVQTLHKLGDSHETVAFSLERDESNGTQRFFGIIGPILTALDEGGLLVVDELDCSMHPQLTRKLVEMFHSEEANPKGAQLIFATHDTNLMTPSLFRRDQIWLTEKTQNGNTELFSLTDIESEKRPRKDEPFEKNYLAGRYGGVPTFGPALEDLGVQ